MNRTVVPMVVAIAAATLMIGGCSPAAAPAPTSAPAAPAATSSAAAAPAAAAAQSTAAPAPAAAWPQKGRPITAVVPFAAGGATDVSARIVLPAVSKELGTPIEVVDKPGGGTQVGNTSVALAKPDGYTIAYSAMPTLVTSYLDPALKAPYTRASFVAIARPISVAEVLAVKADSPYKNLKDLVDAAKANPEKVKIAVSGPLSVSDLPILELEKLAGVKFAHVNFDGDAPGLTAMLGGHVDAAGANDQEVQGQVKSGAMRVLAVLDTQESSFLPGVPTAESQGYKIYMASSHVVLAPAGTPKEVVGTLSQAIKTALDNDQVKSQLKAAGMVPHYLDPAQTAAFWEQMENDIRPMMELGTKK